MINTTITPQQLSGLSTKEKLAYDLTQNVFSLAKIGWSVNKISETLSRADSYGNDFNYQDIQTTAVKVIQALKTAEKQRVQKHRELLHEISLFHSDGTPRPAEETETMYKILVDNLPCV